MDVRTRRTLHSATVADSANACWETPPAVFEALNDTFGPFDVDLFADATNSLLSTWFGPDSDALGPTPWNYAGDSGFANPPYGRGLSRILARASMEAGQHGFPSTWLLPFRGAGWFRTWVLDDRQCEGVWLCDRRIVFFEGGVPRVDEKGRPMPAPFDSCVVRFGRKRRAGRWPVIQPWEVPDHV